MAFFVTFQEPTLGGFFLCFLRAFVPSREILPWFSCLTQRRETAKKPARR